MGTGTGRGKFTLGHLRAARLTPTQVMEMRRLYSEENWTQGALSRSFGISVAQVGRIVRGEAWQRYHQTPTDQEIEHAAFVAEQSEPPSSDEIAASMARLEQKLNIKIEPAAKTIDEVKAWGLAETERLRKLKAEHVEDKPKEDSHE